MNFEKTKCSSVAVMINRCLVKSQKQMSACQFVSA